jgi:hypothetical protein
MVFSPSLCFWRRLSTRNRSVWPERSRIAIRTCGWARGLPAPAQRRGSARRDPGGGAGHVLRRRTITRDHYVPAVEAILAAVHEDVPGAGRIIRRPGGQQMAAAAAVDAGYGLRPAIFAHQGWVLRVRAGRRLAGLGGDCLTVQPADVRLALMLPSCLRRRCGTHDPRAVTTWNWHGWAFPTC